MINTLVLEAFSFGKKTSRDKRNSEEKTRDELKKLAYGIPYSNKDILSHHILGDILPTVQMFMVKGIKKGKNNV